MGIFGPLIYGKNVAGIEISERVKHGLFVNPANAGKVPVGALEVWLESPHNDCPLTNPKLEHQIDLIYHNQAI